MTLQAFRDPKSGELRILKHHVEGAKQMGRTAVFTVRNGSLSVKGCGPEDFEKQFSGLLSRCVLYRRKADVQPIRCIIIAGISIYCCKTNRYVQK